MKNIYYATPPLKTKIGGFGNVANTWYKISQEDEELTFDLENNNQRVGFLYHQPTEVFMLNGLRKKIGYCMFESTKCPPYWEYHLKRFDLLITPSKFARDIFYNQFGVDSIVIPHGIDTDIYKYQEREDSNIFKFLHYNAFDFRKGFDIVIDAFTQEFTDDDLVRLTIKAYSSNNYRYSNYKIDTIIQDYNQEQLLELLGSHDCFVFPSRGEGFGMTPLEAMNTGMPVIIPNAHGIAEYFDDRYCYEIESGMSKAEYRRADYDQHDLGLWYEPKIESVRKQMRQAYNDWQNKTGKFAEGLDKERAEYASQFSLRSSYNKIRQHMVNLL
jgi:glycosyltransferase involved in cell wall biosynthesis